MFMSYGSDPNITQSCLNDKSGLLVHQRMTESNGYGNILVKHILIFQNMVKLVKEVKCWLAILSVECEARDTFQ